MGELLQFAKRRHVHGTKVSEQRGLFEEGQSPEQIQKGKFVGVINEVASLWVSLPDSHPMFDVGRDLARRLIGQDACRGNVVAAESIERDMVKGC